MHKTVPSLAFAALLAGCAVSNPTSDPIFVPTQLLTDARPQEKRPAVPPFPELDLNLTVLAFNILPRARPMAKPGMMVAGVDAESEGISEKNGMGGPEGPAPAPASAPVNILEGINFGGVGAPEAPRNTNAPKLSLAPRAKPERPGPTRPLQPGESLAPPSLRRI